ncbi:rhomboid family intramembrane serine protease [Chloroflexota bacterium]
MYPLPVADTTRLRYRTIPWATLTLIMINVVVWVYTQIQLEAVPDLAEVYGGLSAQQVTHIIFGAVPYAVQEQQGVGAFSAITSTFLHAPGYLLFLPFSWHLFGNMVFLFAFGRRLEDACGPVRFLLFYVLAGLIASTASLLIRGQEPIGRLMPGIGASGAIAGVMGAFLILFPGTRITTVPLIGIIPLPVRIKLPALVLLGWWLAQQIVPAIQTLRGDEFYTTDFVAHLAGFFAGLLIFLFVRKDVLYRYMTGAKL